MDILITDSTPASQTVSASRVTLNLPRPPRAFYRHGWQSWSFAAWTDLSPLPIQKPAIFHVLQTDAAYAHEPLPHGSWVGAAEMDDGRIVLLGALGTDAHVRLDGSHLEGWYESGEGEWFIHFGAEQNAFPAYAQALGERFGFAAARPAPRIWCSWYSLYTAIDELTLHKVFDGLGDLPFDVLQVDDGWQVNLGDWEANNKFPSGMAALADKIKSTGRKAGLWLAPLLAAKSSRLFREHLGGIQLGRVDVRAGYHPSRRARMAGGADETSPRLGLRLSQTRFSLRGRAARQTSHGGAARGRVPPRAESSARGDGRGRVLPRLRRADRPLARSVRRAARRPGRRGRMGESSRRGPAPKSHHARDAQRHPHDGQPPLVKSARSDRSRRGVFRRQGQLVDRRTTAPAPGPGAGLRLQGDLRPAAMDDG
ncbi:hypothetical protein FBQ79_11410 [Anaerolineae bacterium AMX1]|nr:hypothetical protein [Anaerolineae bacterium AMX1]